MANNNLDTSRAKPLCSSLRRHKVGFMWAACIVAFILCAVLCFRVFIGWIASYIDSQRFSSRHVFAIDAPQAHLTEDNALFYARKTLEAEGYDLAKWKPSPEAIPGFNPTGEKIWFLTLGGDPRGGRIQFVNEEEDGNPRRYVEIEMSDEHVTTYVWMPK